MESEKCEAGVVAVAPAHGWHGHLSCAIRMHSITPAMRMSAQHQPASKTFTSSAHTLIETTRATFDEVPYNSEFTEDVMRIRLSISRIAIIASVGHNH